MLPDEEIIRPLCLILGEKIVVLHLTVYLEIVRTSDMI